MKIPKIPTISSQIVPLEVTEKVRLVTLAMPVILTFFLPLGNCPSLAIN